VIFAILFGIIQYIEITFGQVPIHQQIPHRFMAVKKPEVLRFLSLSFKFDIVLKSDLITK